MSHNYLNLATLQHLWNGINAKKANTTHIHEGMLTAQERLDYLNQLETVAFKEVINPLTNDSNSNESPVGSLISYIGSEPPINYLTCDSSIYNILEYPELVEHFIDEFGYSNYYGGDGITTFGVPPKYSDPIIKNITPIMTSNTVPSPYIVSASSEFDATYAAWKVFNGTVLTNTDAWITPNGIVTGWLMLDLSIPTSVSYFKLTARNSTDSSTLSPKNFSLQGSNDGVNFTVIKAFTDQTGWSAAQSRDYILDSIAVYRYYKLDITANNGHTGCLSVGDFQLLFKVPKMECIKYKPTYYAVNQYGGFEKVTIFNGTANALDTTYNLTDNIENYDFIQVFFTNDIALTGYSGTNNACSYETIDVDDIICGNTGQFLHPSQSTNYITFYFVDNKSFKLTDLGTSTTGWSNRKISKMRGIKGQLPTFIASGVF